MPALDDMRICDIVALDACKVNCETYRSRLAAGDSRRHALRPPRVARREPAISKERARAIMAVPVNPNKCRYYGAGEAFANKILKENNLGLDGTARP